MTSTFAQTLTQKLVLPLTLKLKHISRQATMQVGEKYYYITEIAWRGSLHSHPHPFSPSKNFVELSKPNHLSTSDFKKALKLATLEHIYTLHTRYTPQEYVDALIYRAWDTEIIGTKENRTQWLESNQAKRGKHLAFELFEQGLHRQRIKDVQTIMREVKIKNIPASIDDPTNTTQASPIYAIIERDENNCPNYTLYFIADGNDFRDEWENLQASTENQLIQNETLELPNMKALMAQHLAQHNAIKIQHINLSDDINALRTLTIADQKLVENDPHQMINTARERWRAIEEHREEKRK